MPSLQKTTSWLAHSAALLWGVLALLTVGGIVLSTVGWLINAIMGAVFAGIATFFAVRGRALTALLADREAARARRFLQTELLLLLGTNVVGVVLLTAAFSRLFGERLPLFG